MAVAPGAHGPVMMLYVRQPLGTRGAARVYGLRVDQQGGTRPQAGAMVDTATSAMPGQRSIVDLQFRHASDMRVEFGRHVTWNVARREFGLTASQPSMALRLPMSVATGPRPWRVRCRNDPQRSASGNNAASSPMSGR
jgi:hypothetical protein